MSKNINYVSHKKSKVKVNGKPQLPSASVLVEGEIAVNYAENVETLSIKNESGTVVTFSSDDYYSEQKLGSAFTGPNSAVTVTELIVSNGESFVEALNLLNGKMISDIESSDSSIDATSGKTLDGSVKYDITTSADRISGLTAESSITSGSARVSGVSTTDTVNTGIKNLYASLKSEIAARKAAFLARTISTDNKALTITETPNEDGFSTKINVTLDEVTDGSGSEKVGADNAITITNNGLFLSSKWVCGEYE